MHSGATEKKWGRAMVSYRQPPLEVQANEQYTALMYAALSGQTEVVKALLDKGEDVNAKDNEGRTALMFAAINQHSAVVSMLLDHGADANARANDGGTALMLAACGGATDIVRTLLSRGADVRGKFTMTDRTALVIAREGG